MLKRRRTRSESRSRSRSRSRSPPVKIAQLLKLRRKANANANANARSRELIPEADVYRMVYGVYGDGQDYIYHPDFKSMLLEIPSKTLDLFRVRNSYNPDTHNPCHQLPSQPVLLAKIDWYVYSKPILVGRTLYTMATEKLMFDWEKKFDLITLDLDSFPLEWKRCSLPSPLFKINTTSESLLVSLCGCLLVLGAFPDFGAIFSFQLRKWSKLKGPKGVKLNSNHVDFIASLGDSVGKILLHVREGGCGPDSSILIYDVISRNWSKYPGKSLENYYMTYWTKLLDKRIMIHDEDDGYHTLYYVHDSGIAYAFECETTTLFKGKVLGFGKFSLGVPHSAFNHFGGDLFCLCYSSLADGDCDKTIFHFTFIRLIKDRHHSTLNAFTVGCFQETVLGDYFPHGALFL